MGWTLADGSLLTSDVVGSRDLLGRVVDTSTDGFDVNGTSANYVYDPAGRLVSAVTFGAVPASGAAARTTAYDYSSSACGVAGSAGRNGNRVAKTTNGSSVAYCYDHADRLVSTTEPSVGVLGYDSHGNTATLGAETHSYDIADRHVRTGPAAVRAAIVVVGNPATPTNRDNWYKTCLEANGWVVSFFG